MAVSNPFGKNRTFMPIDSILYPKEKKADQGRKTRKTNLQATN